jgi:hypothetical protein
VYKRQVIGRVVGFLASVILTSDFASGRTSA